MSNEPTLPKLTPPVSDRDHVLGSPNASVTLVEYGDYECPDCRTAHGMIQDLCQWFSGDFCFVFRHFPITELHPTAQQAAEIAEAAAAQGQFWQMHNLFFEQQCPFEDGFPFTAATQLRLDTERVVL